MPLSTRRSRRSSIDIWPGFVDALAQLLMVIIFVLLVFTAGQFYLSAALSGRGAIGRRSWKRALLPSRKRRFSRKRKSKTERFACAKWARHSQQNSRQAARRVLRSRS